MDGDQSRWRAQHRRYAEAKTQLKWYRGDYEYPRYRNEQGQLVEDRTKEPIVIDKGYIKKKLNEAARLIEDSNLGAKFLQRTFGNFDKRRDEKAYVNCTRYAQREDLFDPNGRERNSLIICGGVGTGKTHLAAAIANYVVGKGIPALFGTFGEHLESIKEEFDYNDRREYLSKMKNAPLLVLDDLGQENSTDWSRQILFDVINYRYEHKYPIVITTNLQDNELREYLGEALFSRACEICEMVKMTGKDYRRQA